MTSSNFAWVWAGVLPIADSEVLTEECDSNALPTMVASLVEEIGVTPREVLADKGYYTPDLIEEVETTHGCTCVIPYPEQKKSDAATTFQYDAQTDAYTCSEGKLLPIKQKNKRKRDSLVDVYQGIQCQDCRVREACTTSRYGRLVNRYHNHEWRQRYKERFLQPPTKIKVALRKCLVEHPFGTIKLLGGKIPLLLRGSKKVATEINLYATAFNLKRMFNIESFQQLSNLFATYRWETS